LWANSTTDGIYELLLQVALHHGVLIDLQKHFFHIGLKHIDLSPETELHATAWEEWIVGKPGQFVMRKPQNVRNKLSWKELRVVVDRFPSCVRVLMKASGEHAQSANEAMRVLMTLHKLWKPVTECLKQMHHESTETPVSLFYIIAFAFEFVLFLNEFSLIYYYHFIPVALGGSF
jgi:hypothetical protein